MVEWASDVSAADWIVERLDHHPVRGAWAVSGFVPYGLEAYARVLHPARRDECGRPVKVRWAELARARATPLLPSTEFEELRPSASMNDAQAPTVGTLESDELDVLVGVLAAFTESPESCWFGMWEGYGWMNGPPATAELEPSLPGTPQPERRGPGAPPPAGPRVQVPDRSLALYSGPIEAATAFDGPPAHQSPNLWWPDDHAWCVASEIDFRSTYVGGPERLIDRLVHEERLEALPVQLDDRVTD